MYAETARQVVAILGKEPLARGVITAEQLPESIALVERALAGAKAAPTAAATDDEPLPIGMAQRLVPFLELLERTRNDEGYVMWEAAGDFGERP